VRVLPAGPSGLLAEVDGLAEAQALYDDLAARDDADVVDLVPAARTVLVIARPHAVERLRAVLRDWSPGGTGVADGPLVELPVRYDGADLAGVAEDLGLDAAEVARRHAAVEYRVAFCGFAPGFAYLSGLPDDLRVPRLATPRTKVPAGSVGLAGEFCGVYPRESPGGWRLIARTDAPLWDAERQPAALLVPGTRVRFEAVR
jgi:KipI family sensor histidine kinase inhibitor